MGRLGISRMSFLGQRKNKLKTIITYGTFDLFHVGHVRLLKRLKNLGDKLIIGLSSDDFNELKGKKTVMSFEQRKEILLACKYVDDVFEEANWEQKREDIIEKNADVFAMGDDWAGKFDDLCDIVDVVYLTRTEDISSTDVKIMVRKISDEHKHELQNTLESMKRLVEKL
jgi:glycerol-3-phosphate cytidylyltransferase